MTMTMMIDATVNTTTQVPTLQKIQLYSQGIVTEQLVPVKLADQVTAKLRRHGYTVWKVPS